MRSEEASSQSQCVYQQVLWLCCICVISVDVDNNEKKKEELWYIHVVSNLESMPGTLGNAANIGVCFFPPDPSHQPPQLGFHALML